LFGEERQSMEVWTGHDLNNDGSPDLFIRHRINDPKGFLGVFLFCFIGLFLASFFLFSSFDDKEGSHLMGIGIFSILGSAGIAALVGAKVCYGAQFSGFITLGIVLLYFVLGPIGTHWATKSGEQQVRAAEEARHKAGLAGIDGQMTPLQAKEAKIAAQKERIEVFKSRAAKEGWTFSHAHAAWLEDGIISYGTLAYLPASDGDGSVDIEYRPATGFGFAQLRFHEEKKKYPSGLAETVRSYSLKPDGRWEPYLWQTDSYLPREPVRRPDP
jgi:hypothetical protein